ncbi:nitroreductase/quinone reductase family protein [Promicromonospora thailandica]|uniref:Deazaflavin-dependent oxidoreductase, nitroreductase family n=1 Tax=Promicromonospora thailandica TaxID=765201 RepID=A0A9X2G4M0_9MICO|nr:nitroreductase/quinone reductase family protein [Promicromonospora thailandica]MCP2266699.1 deazaflavin-dependent oxidoreductase, nitroreductase family [Promicromonospora thailandica]BFF17212.1 nitroreductase family deazaflavin-dependent oxidoreductase [Promicromonospora thailandica]
MADQNDMNSMIIEAYRANAGVLGEDVAGGHFVGKRLVLLHHVGRVSGTERIAPLVAATDGDAYLVAGSMGGAPKDPDWVANVEDGPEELTIEVGDQTLRARATVVRGPSPEWERLYGIWAEYWPDAKEYETHTDRKFPVVRLEPVA